MRQTIYKVEYAEGKEISCIRYEEVKNDKHKFPIGSLVEIVEEDVLVDVGFSDNTQLGLRLFVVNQHHDEGGYPLYDLSFNKDSYEQEKSRNPTTNSLSETLYYISIGSQLKNVEEDRLKLIK